MTLQSTSGTCQNKKFNLNKVPIMIAIDLNLKYYDYMNVCEYCRTKFIFKAQFIPQFVTGEFIELTEEIQYEIDSQAEKEDFDDELPD